MGHKPRILVVGSFVMDQIVITDVFPQEGQTVLGRSFSKAPGGKGANQAVQVVRLGAEVSMLGKLGKDANGSELIAACRDAGVDTKNILFDETTPSGCSVIILENNADGSCANRIIVVSGSNMQISNSDVVFLKNEIRNYDLVMLQHEIPSDVNDLVASYAFAAGVPVMLNPAPSAPISDSLLSHLTYISPNEHEAEDLTGVHIGHDGVNVSRTDVKKAASELRKKGVGNVLITLGSAGAALFNDDGDFYAPCVQEIAAVDPTAAGDSFVAAFCVGVCCGWGWEEILQFANHTASLTVSKLGAMPSLPGIEQVESLLRSRSRVQIDTTYLK